MELFKIVGITESVSTILLMFVAMPMKYLGDDPFLVKTLGPIHGFLYMLYIGMLYLGQRANRWRLEHVVKGAFWAILPGGPIWFERELNSLSTVDA